MEQENKLPPTKEGDDNLDNDKVKVNIKPDTDDNKTNISICSCILTLSCCVWRWNET